MVKNLLLKSLCFIGLCLQAFPSLSGTDHVAAGLKEAFAGRAPFFAISVSRTTNNNTESEYRPLTAVERYFVGAVLDMVLNGGHPNEKFDEELKAAADEDSKNYKIIKDMLDSIKIKLDTGEFDQEIIQIIQQRSGNSLSSEKLQKEVKKEKNERVLRNITKLQDKSHAFWKKYETEIKAKRRQKIIPKCNQIWLDISSKMQVHRELLSLVRGSYGLIVFNEMFFGKNVSFPLEILEEQFRYFSDKHPMKIFHVNFLVNRVLDTKLTDSYQLDDYYEFLSTHQGAEIISDRGVNKQIFDSDKAYAEYIQQFQQHRDFLFTLENVSRNYFQGDELTRYYKSTYKQENEDDLQRGAFYIFGNSIDLPNLKKECSIVLLDNLATEICYDLGIGMRRIKSSYPEHLKIFVVPSNTLVFTNENMNNLPVHSRLIFHVDPTEQSIFAKTHVASALETESRYIDYKECIWQKDRSIFILQFELEGSLYQIKIWDISRYLS